MERINQGKAWPFLVPLLFAGVFLVYSIGVPLGLAKVEAALPLAAGLSLDSAGLSPVTPFALIAIRLAAYLPLGEFGFRGNLASCLLVSLAVAWMGRLCVDLLVLFRPSREARQGWRDFLYEPIAAVGASLTAAFALVSFESATTVGQSAITILFIVGAWLCVASLIRGHRKVTHGLALAALTGLSSSVHPMAASLLWPILFGIGLWSLHRGERWPLLLLCVFLLTFSGSVLAIFAAASAPLSGREVMASLLLPTFSGIQHVPASILRLCDTLGVIGCILVCIGFLVLLSRHLLSGLWLLITLVTTLLFSVPLTAGGTEPSRLALTLALLICAPMVTCGIFHVSSKMGRARAATALTLSILALITPVLDGGSHRWASKPLLPIPLLERGLAKAAPRAVIEPGSVAMSGLFRFGQAWGLRPDLLYRPSDVSLQQPHSSSRSVEKTEE